MNAEHCPSRRTLLAAAGAALAAGRLGAPASAATGQPPDLDAELHRQGVVGTFAHLDVSRDRLSLANAGRAGTRFVPASTFKIANSLIALEVGAVADETEVFRWDGKPRQFKSWEQDMNLRQAVPASNVPVFQEVARRVGIARYEQWLERLEYGNGAVGSSVDTFWLDGPLKISAIEQTSFLAALALGQLPVSRRVQDIVRDILKIETRNGRTLYAKTGWCFSTTPELGWWVGWVEGRDRIDTFALNIDLVTPEDGPKRVALGRSMLAALGVL